MIHLSRVSKRVLDEKNGARFVLRDVSISLPANIRIAVLGEDQQDLTTTLHLLAGSEIPDGGRIVTDRLRRSPIVNAGGVAGGSLMRQMSGLENIYFLARIHGVDPGRLLALVESACRLESRLRTALRDYDAPLRRALEVTLFAALPFDIYFIDRLDRFDSTLLSRLAHAVRRRGAGLFFTAKNLATAANLADAGVVVEHGTIRILSEMKQAISADERRRG
jgi:capsular polysaccharide transport system ATP-binding protein